MYLISAILSAAESEAEKNYVEINRLVSMLTIAGMLTPSQSTRLAQAVTSAASSCASENSYEKCGIAALGRLLQGQKRATADNAYAKLRTFFSYNLIQDANHLQDLGVFYEIDLNGLPVSDQDVVANFLLEYFLDDILSKRFTSKGGLTLYIDEAQNYNFSKGSALFHLLNESRKTETDLIIVATAFDDKATATDQAHFRVSFQTRSPKEIEALVAVSDVADESVLRVTIPNLVPGRCLLLGDFMRCDKYGTILDNNVSHCITAYTYIPSDSCAESAVLSINGST